MSPYPITPIGHGRFCCEPRARPQAEPLAPTLEEAKGWEYTPGDTGLQPPRHERGLHGLSHSINTHHRSGMCPQLSPTGTRTVGHSCHLCWRMSLVWVVPQLPWPLLWERRDGHSLRSKVQEACGTPKATLGAHPSISGPADGSNIFPPSCLLGCLQLLWLSPDRGLFPWQWEVTSGCGGQSDMCLTMQETRQCLSVS